MVLKAVIFDLGGTLICYPPLDTISSVCEEFGKDIAGIRSKILIQMSKIYEEEREKSFQSLEEITFDGVLIRAFKECGFSLNNQEYRTILEKLYYFSMGKHAKLCRGAIGLLREIKNLNLKTGLISNTPFLGEFHEEDLRRFRIFSYFDIRIWSSQFGFRKPHPAIFNKALQIFGVSLEEAVYIGDQFSRDVEGPNSIGMPAIWIHSKKEEMEFCGWQVSKLSEITKIIRHLATPK